MRGLIYGKSISSTSCWKYAYDTFQFLNIQQPKLEGKINLKFIGTNFLSRSEMKKWKTQLSEAKKKVCDQNGRYFVAL